MASKKAVKVVKKLLPAEEAKKMAATSIVELHVEPRTVYQNVKLGLSNLRGAQGAIEAKLKHWDTAALTRYAAINDAFLSTAISVSDAEPKADVELANDKSVAWSLRRVLLNQAQGAAMMNFIPQQEVDAIVRGGGIVDCAADCVALAKLLRKYSATIGKKTFVTEAQLTQATEVGQRLQRKVKTKSAKLTPGELVKARDLRNRLYTLLGQTHEELWGVAALVFGRAHLDETFPPMSAHLQVKPKPAVPAEAPALAVDKPAKGKAKKAPAAEQVEEVAAE